MLTVDKLLENFIVRIKCVTLKTTIHTITIKLLRKHKVNQLIVG